MNSKNIYLSFLAVLIAVLVFSFPAMAEDKGPIKNGDEVSLEYTGTLKDGTVFDSSEKHGKPLTFVLGKGLLLKKFEANVLGMKLGEEKTFTLTPQEAYGEYNPKLKAEISRSKLPAKPDPKPGMTLGMDMPDGSKRPATITKVSGDKVTVDMNPPLAGKTLTFKIKITNITQQS